MLLSENWNSLYELGENTDDINKLYGKFLDTFKFYFNTAFPLKSRRAKRTNGENNNDDNKGWVTAGIRISCAKKRELHKLNKLSNDAAFGRYVREYKKVLNKCIKLAKLKYNTSKIQSSCNKTKTAWKIVKREINIPDNRNELFEQLCRSNAETSKRVLDSFNRHFKNTCHNLNVAPDANKAMKFLSNAVVNSEVLSSFNSLHVSDVKKIIQQLNPSKTPGYDELPPFVLKQCLHAIYRPVTFLINLSFKFATFPNLLKYSNIIPILKKGSPTDFNNYRPISVLPAFSKIFERAAVDQLMHFFDRNSYFSKHQFGFRRGKNTTEAINEFLTNIMTSLDSSRSALGIFCDLSKAFDSVNHSLLLGKLRYYGISGKAYSWVESYLSGRKQCVCLRTMNRSSSYDTLVDSVPQGSILGPCLFLIYVNDLPISVLKSQVTMFADDTTAAVTAKSNAELSSLAHHNIFEMNQWFKANGLLLNTEKTHAIKFQLSNNANPVDFVAPNNLCISSTATFLGLVVDEGLTWKDHIKELSKKLNRAYFVILTLSRVVDKKVLSMVYYAYVYSLLSYGVIFWGNSVHSEKIFIIKKKIIRAIKNLKSRESCRNSFKELKILPLPCIYILQISLFMYKNLSKFKKSSELHNYNTRNKSTLLYPRHRTSSFESIPQYSGLRIYNRLPDSILAENSIKHFKCALIVYLNQNCFYSVEEFLNS